MSTEQNRSQASQQYFKLRKELNRANKTKNLKTELEFIIRETEDKEFIIIKSTAAEHGIQLAFRFKNEPLWSFYENYIYEDFCKYMFFKIIRLNRKEEININATLTSWLLRLWIS